MTTTMLALLHRDLRVARRELPYFLLRVGLQPLLFTFIFGFVMPRMGIIQHGYTDMLLPGIETCKKCHAPGPEHAESRCFECHTYHDWSKRKEVTPKFTLPALRTGDR